MVPNQAAASAVADGGSSVPLGRWPLWLQVSLAVAALIALISSLAALAVLQERERFQERAAVATQNVAQLLDQHITDVFDGIDFTLQSAAYYHREQQDSGRPDAAHIQAFLKYQASRQHNADSLRILDEQGFVRHGHDDAVGPSVNLSDRDFFRMARDDPNPRLIVWGPVFARIAKRWVIVLARRIDRPDGSFGGVVYANLAVSRFETMLSSASIGPRGAATIRMADQALVYRYPAGSAAVGSKEVSAQLRDIMASGSARGSYVAPTAVDGIERSNAYSRLQRYPLYVIVGLAVDDYLGGSQGNTRAIVALSTVAVASILLSGGLVYRSTRRLRRDIEARMRLEAALATSEASLRDLYEHAPCGYHSLDAEGKFVQINATELSWIGCTREQVIGQKGPADFTTDEGRARMLAQFPKFKASGRLEGIEFEMVAKDGQLRPVRVDANAVYDAAGRFLMSRSVVFDITAQKQAEQSRVLAVQLEAENRKLREAGRLKTLFLANMSHELRTPLNGVIGLAQVLESGIVPIDSPKHGHYLAQIGASGRHLLELIDNMLDFANAEAGTMEFRPQKVEIAALVREVIGTYQTSADDKDLAIVTEIDPGLGDIVTDPLRLRQALSNYLSNAVKFTPAGGRVAVRARPDGPDRVCLEVQDNGIGIAEADLPRLFVAFQQLSEGVGKAHGGTGIGLALTRKLIEAQGGSVGVSSRLGEGSVFHLSLPRVPAQ